MRTARGDWLSGRARSAADQSARALWIRPGGASGGAAEGSRAGFAQGEPRPGPGHCSASKGRAGPASPRGAAMVEGQGLRLSPRAVTQQF